MTTGEKVRHLREQMGLSQEQLAQKLGIARQTVSKWERDCVVPDSENWRKLCRLFSVPMEYFLPEGAQAPDPCEAPAACPADAGRATGGAQAPAPREATDAESESAPILRGKRLVAAVLGLAMLAVSLCFWLGFSSVVLFWLILLLIYGIFCVLRGKLPAERNAREISRFLAAAVAGMLLGLCGVAAALPAARMLAQPGQATIRYGVSPAVFAQQADVQAWLDTICRPSGGPVQVYRQTVRTESGDLIEYDLIYRKTAIDEQRSDVTCPRLSQTTQVNYKTAAGGTEKEELDLLQVQGKAQRQLYILMDGESVEVPIYPYGQGDISIFFEKHKMQTPETWWRS